MKSEDVDVSIADSVPIGLSHEEKLARYNINKRTAIFTIFLSIVIDVLGYSMIMPLLPVVVTTEFGASNFFVGVLIASNALAALLFAPVWGKFSDNYGRRVPLVICQLGTFASFLLLGISNSVVIIFASRVLDGMFGGQIPIIRAYVIDVTDAKSRSTEMGRFTSGMAFGMIFGPAIGGLVGLFNWRFPAFIACTLSVISIILTLRFLVESMPKQRRVELQARRQQNHNMRSKRFRALNKIVIIRLIQVVCIGVAFGIIFSSFSLVLNLRFGLNVGMIGIFAAFAGICMAVFGAVLMKPLTKKFGERNMLLASLLIAVFTFLSYPFLVEVWMLYVYVVPFMFMNIFIRTYTLTNLSKPVEEDDQGLVSGYASNMFSVGQIISPLIAYFYLDIVQISIGTIVIDAYFMIGWTCLAVILLMFAIIAYDMKKNPQDFLQKEIKKVAIS